MKVDEAISKILEFELDEQHYPELPEEFWKNNEFIITCLENDHHIDAVFNYVDQSMWSNKKFVLPLIEFFKTKKENHLEDALNKIEPKLKKDKDIIKVPRNPSWKESKWLASSTRTSPAVLAYQHWDLRSPKKLLETLYVACGRP